MNIFYFKGTMPTLRIIKTNVIFFSELKMRKHESSRINIMYTQARIHLKYRVFLKLIMLFARFGIFCVIAKTR